MASAEHIKALLQSHADGDDDRFYSIAMQMAAHEARLGHGKLAKELRDLIDAAKASRDLVPTWSPGTMRGGSPDVLHWTFPKARLGDLIHSDPLAEQIRRVIREHRQASRILEHGLSPRRKLLSLAHMEQERVFLHRFWRVNWGFHCLRFILMGCIHDSRTRHQIS